MRYTIILSLRGFFSDLFDFMNFVLFQHDVADLFKPMCDSAVDTKPLTRYTENR
jgi:hypothetical protein